MEETKKKKSKKPLVIVIVAVVAVVLILAAIGGNNSKDDPVPSSDASVSDTTDSKPADEPKGNSFVDGVITTDDYVIKITDYKVIPKGEKGNEYGKAPVIAFWFDCTNKKTDETISPSSTWLIGVKAIQDNDPNKVNELSVGACPDSELSNNQMADIKPGGTLSCAVAYELTDDTTPVELKAGALFGDGFGSQIFDIAK